MRQTNPLWLVIGALFLAVLWLLITRPTPPPPEPQIVETVDTLIVTKWKTQIIERERIKPVIVPQADSGYIAVLDTLITNDSGVIGLRVEYEHPTKLFNLGLKVETRIDTVYINRERIITTTTVKTNWNATIISGLIGFAAGSTVAILAQ